MGRLDIASMSRFNCNVQAESYKHMHRGTIKAGLGRKKAIAREQFPLEFNELGVCRVRLFLLWCNSYRHQQQRKGLGRSSLEIVMMRAERLDGVIEKEGMESALFPDPESQ